MTQPNSTETYEKLRKRWLGRYATVQKQVDKELKSVLTQAAENAYNQSLELVSSETFSASVKSAQLRLLIKELSKILKEVFDEELKIIKNGQKQSALAAVDAFAETDRDYLREVFSNSGDVQSFIKSQRLQAVSGVVNAINRITKTDQPLSARVYRTRSLANRWIQRDVNIGILKNDSAKEIAQRVRRHIKPTTNVGVSYAAMRLARTEVNNAFHASSVDLAQDRPWVEGMLWNLSRTHDYESKCICRTYANTSFAIATVPPKPHPQCRCFVTPEVESYEMFLQNLTAGQYRDWINNAA